MFDYDREAMFPKYHADVEAGRALCAPAGVIEAAQDRVAMRRHIARSFPPLASTLRDLGEVELSALIANIEELQS